MAALNFPDSPNDGDEFSGYVYDSAKGVWNRLPTLPALDLVNFSAVAPSNPQDGQFWFDTTSSKMYVYYNDGSSAQWVSTIGGLASQTGSEGQFLIHDGTEWLASEFTSPGSVLQVVSTTKTDTFSTTSTSFTDITGLSASITPTSTTSKILVFGYIASGADSDRLVHFRLLRNATPIGVGDAAGSRLQTNIGYFYKGSDDRDSYMTNAYISFLDSPATTSATTYKFQVLTNAGTLNVNKTHLDVDASTYGRASSTITVMEIAG